jgi:hypothetical protein
MTDIPFGLAAAVLLTPTAAGIALSFISRRWAKKTSSALLYTALAATWFAAAVAIFNPVTGALVFGALLVVFVLLRWRLKRAGRRLNAITHELRNPDDGVL